MKEISQTQTSHTVDAIGAEYFALRSLWVKWRRERTYVSSIGIRLLSMLYYSCKKDKVYPLIHIEHPVKPGRIEMAEYLDRKDAGKKLSRLLLKYTDRSDVLVLGLPRGGVPVANEVAKALHAPLDIFIVRKLGVPGQDELAMGAIASGGVRVLNQDIVHNLGIPEDVIAEVSRREQQELARRLHVYRGGLPPLDLQGKNAILVDDGLATGASMRAAVLALRQESPLKIIVAVPVGATETCQEFVRIADEIVCRFTPEPFYGVGAWYDDFSQIGDEEVREILLQANQDLLHWRNRNLNPGEKNL
ncbi:MAG: phosphoribosyltransferase [Anaerolineaceae bacterium]|nr:phosphoribosyltransferase [Anaerolineaceae bacterium]